MNFARPLNPQPIQGDLAILVPTYRFDARAKLVIQNVMALASEQVAVLVADNSENPEKWDELARFANGHPNIHVFCHAKNIGAFENWAFLMGQGNTPYVCYVGDDDFVTPDYFPRSVALLNEHPEATLASGLFVQHYRNIEPALINNVGGPRLEATGLERIQQYFLQTHGNVVSCCVMRRTAFARHLPYLREHPLVASFFDWVMACGMLAQGSYEKHTEGAYWYDATNWTDPQTAQASDAKFYVEAGLPASFVSFHQLYWAVEMVHYFLGRYAPPLPWAERVQIADFLCRRHAVIFMSNLWQPHRAHFSALLAHDPEAEAAIDALLAVTDVTDPRLFSNFARVIQAFSPTIAAEYLAFMQGSLQDTALAGRNS